MSQIQPLTTDIPLSEISQQVTKQWESINIEQIEKIITTFNIQALNVLVDTIINCTRAQIPIIQARSDIQQHSALVISSCYDKQDSLSSLATKCKETKDELLSCNNQQYPGLQASLVNDMSKTASPIQQQTNNINIYNLQREFVLADNVLDGDKQILMIPGLNLYRFIKFSEQCSRLSSGQWCEIESRLNSGNDELLSQYYQQTNTDIYIMNEIRLKQEVVQLPELIYDQDHLKSLLNYNHTQFVQWIDVLYITLASSVFKQFKDKLTPIPYDTIQDEDQQRVYLHQYERYWPQVIEEPHIYMINQNIGMYLYNCIVSLRGLNADYIKELIAIKFTTHSVQGNVQNISLKEAYIFKLMGVLMYSSLEALHELRDISSLICYIQHAVAMLEHQ